MWTTFSKSLTEQPPRISQIGHLCQSPNLVYLRKWYAKNLLWITWCVVLLQRYQITITLYHSNAVIYSLVIWRKHHHQKTQNKFPQGS